MDDKGCESLEDTHNLGRVSRYTISVAECVIEMGRDALGLARVRKGRWAGRNVNKHQPSNKGSHLMPNHQSPSGP